MKKKILILSATCRSNLELSKEIAAQAPKDVETSMVILEELNIPLYTPQAESAGIPATITKLATQMAKAGGFVLVAPEYNGSMPPVVNNAIAWLSRAGDDWRASFAGKFAVVATMSGGGGAKVIQAMRGQLEHLGTTVHAHALMCASFKPLNAESAKKVMGDLGHWLR